jgi:acylphosphatase
MNHVQLIVSGRVQMVRFRVFVVKVARGLGIVGTVENLPDGTVRIEAWGDKTTLQALIQKVSKGSRLSRVDNIAEVWDNREYISLGIDEFRIIH